MRRFLELSFLKAILSLKSEASKSYLSYSWWILEPMLHLGTYYIVFDVFRKSNIPNFAIYLIVGIVPWLWFNKSVMNACHSIEQGKNILLAVPINKLIFPVSVAIQDLFKQGFVFTILVTFLFFGSGLDFSPLPSLLKLGFVAFLQLLLVSSIACFVALIVPLLPDIRFLISTALHVLFFASGIFYSYDLILDKHLYLFYLNPMACLIKAYRDIFIYHQDLNMEHMLYVLALSGGFLIATLLLIKLFKTNYIRLMLK